jgi:hypothetical protein
LEEISKLEEENLIDMIIACVCEISGVHNFEISSKFGLYNPHRLTLDTGFSTNFGDCLGVQKPLVVKRRQFKKHDLYDLFKSMKEKIPPEVKTRCEKLFNNLKPALQNATGVKATYYAKCRAGKSCYKTDRLVVHIPIQEVSSKGMD